MLFNCSIAATLVAMCLTRCGIFLDGETRLLPFWAKSGKALQSYPWPSTFGSIYYTVKPVDVALMGKNWTVYPLQRVCASQLLLREEKLGPGGSVAKGLQYLSPEHSRMLSSPPFSMNISCFHLEEWQPVLLQTITEDDLLSLRPLSNVLENLSFCGNVLSTSVAQTLGNTFPYLKTLNIHRALGINDSGLRMLVHLKSLEQLNIGFLDDITDAGECCLKHGNWPEQHKKSTSHGSYGQIVSSQYKLPDGWCALPVTLSEIFICSRKACLCLLQVSCH